MGVSVAALGVAISPTAVAAWRMLRAFLDPVWVCSSMKDKIKDASKQYH